MTILTSISRIVIIDNRYYPQIKNNGKWTKVLSNKWDGKWYIPPKGFTGFQGIRNAEITLEWCEERIKMENRRYIINKAKKKYEKKSNTDLGNSYSVNNIFSDGSNGYILCSSW